MPQITIETTVEEQEAMLKVIKAHDGEVLPVRVLADEAGLRQSRARYVIVDLLEADKITRQAHKAYNKHYVRYSYSVL